MKHFILKSSFRYHKFFLSDIAQAARQLHVMLLAFILNYLLEVYMLYLSNTTISAFPAQEIHALHSKRPAGKHTKYTGLPESL